MPTERDSARPDSAGASPRSSAPSPADARRAQQSRGRDEGQGRRRGQGKRIAAGAGAPRTPSGNLSAANPNRRRTTTTGTSTPGGSPQPTNLNKSELRRIQQTGVSQPIRVTLLALLRTAHPRQAVAVGVGITITGLLLDRPLREALVSGLAVLLIQVVLGMNNDLVDRELDATSQTPNKPLADGDIAPGTVTFLAFLALLLAVPAALQNGALAGLFLLSTLLVGLIHNRMLKRGPLSFVGWCATFALYVPFLTYGNWGLGPKPIVLVAPASATPSVLALVLAALLGLVAHLATAIPDLAHDDKVGIRPLPLLISSSLGRQGLLILTVTLGAIVTIAFVWAALSTGLTS